MTAFCRKNIFRCAAATLAVALIACQPAVSPTPTDAAPTAPDRSSPPHLGDPKKMTLPEIQTFSLSNGIPVYLMEKHSVPIVQVILQISAGALNDPDAKVGLASFTSSMLDEGAGGRDALELADAIEFLGANLGTGSGRYTSTVSLNVPVAKLGDAMPLMADVVLRPDFPEDDLNKLKARSLTSLLQERDSPNAIARAAYSNVLYGEHPFGRRRDESSINGTGIEDIKTFHLSYYGSNNAAFIIAGDIDAAAAKTHLENHFSGWGKSSEPTVEIEEVPQVVGRTLYLVDKPEAAQSVIILGRMGASRYSDDYFPITVMNTVLGGSFTSRLNYNLRETHGYAYGAGSRFSMGKHKGPFTASASVQTDATDKAVAEFMKELNAIGEEITETEIVRARNYVALGYPGRFETIGDYASQIAMLVHFGLPLTTFNDYTDGVMNVTASQALGTARRYIDIENLVIVVVGDREKVETGIRNLGLGELTVWTIEDVLGPPPAIQ